VADVNIIVQPAVGWVEQQCHACGRSRADYIEIHLRHSGTKLVLCSECDELQLNKPRLMRTRTDR
jgi:hypothetical protein